MVGSRYPKHRYFLFGLGKKIRFITGKLEEKCVLVYTKRGGRLLYLHLFVTVWKKLTLFCQHYFKLHLVQLS